MEARRIWLNLGLAQKPLIDGESLYLFGRRYRLDVMERHGRHEVGLKNNTRVQLIVSPGTTLANREMVLSEWYRAELKKRIPEMIARLEPLIGVQVAHWGVKKMKTKWGTCNIEARRILLNLGLAQKPLECLEYILVHEMVHLLERHHNDNFKRHMNRYLPQWRIYRERLNRAPLGHENWGY